MSTTMHRVYSSTLLCLCICTLGGNNCDAADEVERKLEQNKVAYEKVMTDLHGDFQTALKKEANECARIDDQYHKSKLSAIEGELELLTVGRMPRLINLRHLSIRYETAYRKREDSLLRAVQSYDKLSNASRVAELKKELDELRATQEFPVSGVKYRLIVAYGGLAMEAVGKSPRIIVSDIADKPSQLWTFKNLNGVYQIINVESGMLINIPNGSSEQGLELIQFRNQDGVENELWKLVPQGETRFRFDSYHKMSIADSMDGAKRGESIVQTSAARKGSRSMTMWMLAPVK